MKKLLFSGMVYALYAFSTSSMASQQLICSNPTIGKWYPLPEQTQVNYSIVNEPLIDLTDQHDIQQQIYFSYVNINQENYSQLANLCAEHYIPQVVDLDANIWSIFKISDGNQHYQFAKGVLSVACSQYCDFTKQIINTLQAIYNNPYNVDYRIWFNENKSQLKLQLVSQRGAMGTHFNHENYTLSINLFDLNGTYQSSEGEVPFTISRLFAHEIIHAFQYEAFGEDQEAETIYKTNILLEEIGLELPERQVDEYNPLNMLSNTDQKSFARALPEPTPEQRFNAFFNRPG